MIPVLLLAAALPGVYWDGPSTSAAQIRESGIETIYVQSAQVAQWKTSAVRAIPITPEELSQRRRAAKPGIASSVGVASASSAPWIDANGWQFGRDAAAGYYYDDLPPKSAPLAAAEAYAYGVNALLRVTPENLPSLRVMLAFLRTVDRPDLPVRANIGVIDDGSEASGEVMNLLARRNLLFRVVHSADPSLDLTLLLCPSAAASAASPGCQASTPAWDRTPVPVPASEWESDASMFAATVRQHLSDEKRLLRIYGTEVVLARLTGDGSHARLHLLNYSGRTVEGLRVRLLGRYPKIALSIYGTSPTAPLEPTIDGETTEFTVPPMGAYAVVDLESVD